jgi:phosphonate transport system substrate-binding protein
MMAVVPLAALVAIVGALVYLRATQVKATSLSAGLIANAQRRLTRGLDPKFTDADRDLVADVPTDPARLVDPETIVFSYIATDDPAQAETTWKPVMDRIAAATGKAVTYLAGVHDADGQIEAMRQGRLHVTGFNTGNVPAAVDLAGFVPCCVMAAPDGSYSYEMEIIVPAGSPIKAPADLKGHVLTFTDLGSNSGCKAPLILLKNKFGLEPGHDYDVNVSYGHDKSIAGIAAGKFEAAAVANEILKRELGRGKVKESQFRSIYRSEGFPPACIGYAHDLKPELAAKIREALLSFDWKGTSLETAFGGAGKARFVPISYKDQWSFVRDIDEEIGRIGSVRR